MKFGKKSKLMAAAIGLLALSAAGSVTGTVAWFTASNTVQASNMYVMAEKEEGIVMNNEGLLDSAWSTAIDASHDGKISGTQAGFVPTSTNNAAAWAHAVAELSSDKTGIETSYAMLTPTLNGTTGVYNANIDSNTKNIYLLNQFYIKSSTPSAIDDQELWAKVTAKSEETTPVSEDLNQALRVLVRYGVKNGNSYDYAGATIFAPFRGSDIDYNVCTGVGDDPSTTDVVETDYLTKVSTTAYKKDSVKRLGAELVDIPANTLDGTNKRVDTLQAEVYIYFEGEDPLCYSDNITATLDKLSVVVKIGTSSNL